MPHITICPVCGRCYEEGSEEEANSPDRECISCWNERKMREEKHSCIVNEQETVRLVDGDGA